MKLFVILLWISLMVVAALGQDSLKLQIVNVSPVAKIQAAPLIIDKEKQKFSFSLTIENTGAKNIRALFLEFKTKGEIRGYSLNTSVRGERIETSITPKEKKTICVIENADLPRFLKAVSASTISIMRVEFDDGTVWEQPSESKGESKARMQPNNSLNPTPR
jgi:hypothetical protein